MRAENEIYLVLCFLLCFPSSGPRFLFNDQSPSHSGNLEVESSLRTVRTPRASILLNFLHIVFKSATKWFRKLSCYSAVLTRSLNINSGSSRMACFARDDISACLLLLLADMSIGWVADPTCMSPRTPGSGTSLDTFVLILSRTLSYEG
jgi:hypothetical protein